MKKFIHGWMLPVFKVGLKIGFGVALVVTVATTVEAQEDIEQGRTLFESRCPVCHQLPEPSMLKLSQWRRLLDTMQKRMQQSAMAPLTDREFQQVLDYLATQARN